MATTKLLLCLFCFTSFIGNILHDGSLLERKDNNESAIRSTIRKIALSQVGVRERTGHNDGYRVEEYLRTVNLQKGQPWCAAFVSWVYMQAGLAGPGSGWSPALFPHKRLVTEPHNGDVFGIYFERLKRIAHVGIITDTKGSWLFVVEGNTTIAGSREGDGVYRKVRHRRAVAKMADWISIK